MNIAQAFSDIFSDRRWFEKMGIGALVMMVPILNFAGFGVQVRVIRRVISGSAAELPDWDDLVALWREGLWIGLAYLVYAIPFFLIVGGAVVVVPLLWALLDLRDAPIWIPLLLMCGVGPLLLASYGTVLALLRPAILGSYSTRGTFASCFDLAEFVRLIGKSTSAYIALGLTLIAMGVALAFLSIIVLLPISLIPFLGQALSPVLYSAGMFLLMLVQASLIGQWLRASERGEPTASLVEEPG